MKSNNTEMGSSLALPSSKNYTRTQTMPCCTNRCSMTPAPWAGLWYGLWLGLVQFGLSIFHLKPQKTNPVQEAWQRAASLRRSVFLLLTIGLSTASTALFIQIQPDSIGPWFAIAQAILFALLFSWIITGLITAFMGFWVMLRGDSHAMSAQSVAHKRLSKRVRTAVVMPICNEDTSTVFAGLKAIADSLVATGHAENFDLFVLSDSSDAKTIAAEQNAWEQIRYSLATDHATPVQIYYRLRKRRVHRKAGNVADFCRRWGKDYRYMIVLDADSVMSGECLVTLTKLMENNPKAGIIQTATQAVGQVTLHARVQQFSARVIGRIFALGMQYWQLGESHYFGHNAIIRTEPFIKHCALAPIKGKGGLKGDIMSHDFVEAALMRRAGYFVWMVSDLQGSYEQQPADLISELQRDRRWCQGNIQNAQLIAEPGLHRIHRVMLATGFMSYFSALLWLLFLTIGTYTWVVSENISITIKDLDIDVMTLWICTLGALFTPRILAVIGVILKKEQHLYGGTIKLIGSSMLEILVSLLLAPIRMVAHTVFVITALTGIKLDWKSPPRGAVSIPWNSAIAHFFHISLFALATVIFIFVCEDIDALLWLSPVIMPLVLVIPVAVITSRIGLGEKIRKQKLLLIPEELYSPVVLRKAWRNLNKTLQLNAFNQNIHRIESYLI